MSLINYRDRHNGNLVNFSSIYGGKIMLRMLFKLIFLCIVGFIVFLALSVYSGGEKFRWFGKKVEQQSEKVGEHADRVKQGSDRVIKGIEKTTEKVKEFMGSKGNKKDEKSH